jgi:sulfate transport system ATP-binding protein
MHEGRVAQVGQPQEVYDRPATPFVASFVGGANVLHGHMREGRASVGDRASVGSFVVNGPDGTHAPDGTAVNAFVRPHDVTLTKAGDGAPEVSVARVERLTWLGGYVKVALKLSDGAPMTVEMPKGEVEALAIREGDLVMANLREAKVFVEDYSI